jgi:hypothetical protein
MQALRVSGAGCHSSDALLLEHALLLRHPGRDVIHQSGRQAVIGLEPEFPQPATHAVHFGGIDARLDDRRHEGGKARLGPARFLEALGMNEIEALMAWSRSTGPYMCTPQSLQAWRWISADGSTTTSLSPFSSTVTFSCAVTATTENLAPSGFQHLVQPQMWLWATCPLIATLTGGSAQAQTSVPPVKLALPGLQDRRTNGDGRRERVRCR